MAELTETSDMKLLALYLPQFHAIPENDRWWGKGFTEWTNVKKAKPLFSGHYQPRTPFQNDYYDLSDTGVMERQARLARTYGIYGFCYYHYWFKGGKKLLEKPVEHMLENKNVDIPFCLSWANENWSRNWDGGNREVIMEQDYGQEEEWERHFQYLLPFFKDSRYIRCGGQPVLFLYKPEQVRFLNEMADYWRMRAGEEGFPGIVIVRQHQNSYFMDDFDSSRIDYTAKFEPGFERAFRSAQGRKIGSGFLKRAADFLKNKSGRPTPSVYSYDEVWDTILEKEPYHEKMINGAFVDWDNTPRNRNGIVYSGANPQKFEYYLERLLNKKSAMNVILVNAWNEWAEGAYLEPDEKYGYGYLKAVRNALKKRDGYHGQERHSQEHFLQYH